MNIDEIIAGLQKAVEEMRQERRRLDIMEETVLSIIAEADAWFEAHGHELPKKGG